MFKVEAIRNSQRALVISGALMVLGLSAGARMAAAVEIISIAVSGKAGNAPSSGPIANTDGNFIAFYSDATDLVRGDDNQARDVFLRDRAAGTTEIISVNSAGEQANRPSHAQGDAPGLNGDGNFVAFYSDATNLVPDDNNAHTDVFMRDRAAQTTEIVSLASNGSQGNGPSLNPAVDLTGNLVAFQSLANNLTAGDTNNVSDVFVRNRAAGTTERICDSIQGNGASFAPAISADGFVVAFTSAATNLVPNDNNAKLDVFTCDRRSGAIEIISVSSAGVLGNGDSILPAISFDGTYVAYKSLADNLVPNDHNNAVDVFYRDRNQGITVRVSVNFFGGDANDGSYPPSISHDGRFVAFGSAANNIVRGDVNGVPSVFVRDMTIGLSLLVDLNDEGEQANDGTPDVPPAISGNGRNIGYVSFASNLNVNDLNGTADVYLGRNPFFCDDENPCPPPLICVDGMCVEPGGTRTPTPTRSGSPTPTSTAGPDDCCQCEVAACQEPGASGCPAQCDIVRDAVCLGGANCATFTPTRTGTPTATGTPTHTAGPEDCCQCSENACQQPGAGGCPAECTIVDSAVCVDGARCATFTPTPTRVAGPEDCCQCGTNSCQQPSAGSCPQGCDIIDSAVCLGGVNCATFTPTIPPTPSPTPTLPCPTTTPCQLGSFPNCTDPTNPCTCTGCLPCPVGTPCPGGGECVFSSINSCVCSCQPAPTHTATTTPQRSTTATITATAGTTATATASATAEGTKRNLDRDACDCSVSPDSPRFGNGALLWLSGAFALILRQRRRR